MCAEISSQTIYYCARKTACRRVNQSANHKHRLYLRTEFKFILHFIQRAVKSPKSPCQCSMSKYAKATNVKLKTCRRGEYAAMTQHNVDSSAREHWALSHAVRGAFSLRKAKEVSICWLTSLINAEYDSFYLGWLRELEICNSNINLNHFKHSHSLMQI